MDPGTATTSLVTFVRLFTQVVDGSCQRPDDADEPPRFDSALDAELAHWRNLFDDAFQAIGRDGASPLELPQDSEGLLLDQSLPKIRNPLKAARGSGPPWRCIMVRKSPTGLAQGRGAARKACRLGAPPRASWR